MIEALGVVGAVVAVALGVGHHRRAHHVDRMSRQWCEHLRIEQARAAGRPVETVWKSGAQDDGRRVID